MRFYASVVLLTTLSACGGSGVDPVVQEIVLDSALTAAPTPDPMLATTIPSGTGDVTFASLLNQVRADNGAAPVTYDSRLDQAAQLHAEDMLENGYFAHAGLNGSSVGTRVQEQGYNFARVGENIGRGYQSEQTVLNGWVNSPGHQRNNIDPRFEEFGLGYVRDENDTRWVLVLGTEQ